MNRLSFRSVEEFSLDRLYGKYSSSIGSRTQIDLVTVSEAILTMVGKRMRNYSVYQNLMSNNFRGTAVLKKNMNCKLRLQLLRILLKKIEGFTCARRPRTNFLNFLLICL